SDHRLVRRLDRQHPRQPRQNGFRPLAGHRHRGVAWRFRARACAPGKPAGLRQDHRAFLNSLPPMTGNFRRLAVKLVLAAKQVIDTMAGWLAARLLRLLRRTDPDRLADLFGDAMRRIGPWLPEHRLGRANLRAAFPEKSPAEIETILTGVWDNLGRVAAEFPHLDRMWDYDRAHPKAGRAESTAKTDELFDRM